MALLPTSTCHISFDQFVREAMSDDPPSFARVGCQTRFLSPGGSGGPITHLFHYEQMDLACKFLENRLELELDLPWLNQAAIWCTHGDALVTYTGNQSRESRFRIVNYGLR